MPQQQVAASEAPSALGALEGLLLGVGTLVALEVLESSEGTIAGPADVRPRFVGLGEGKAPAALEVPFTTVTRGRQELEIEATRRLFASLEEAPSRPERAIPFSTLPIPPLAVAWDDVAAGMARDCC